MIERDDFLYLEK